MDYQLSVLTFFMLLFLSQNSPFWCIVLCSPAFKNLHFSWVVNVGGGSLEEVRPRISGDWSWFCEFVFIRGQRVLSLLLFRSLSHHQVKDFVLTHVPTVKCYLSVVPKSSRSNQSFLELKLCAGTSSLPFCCFYCLFI